MTASLADRLAAWSVPSDALYLGRLRAPVQEILDYFERLNVVVPPVPPIVFDRDMRDAVAHLGPRATRAEVLAWLAGLDDEVLDDLLVTEPYEQPDLELLAEVAASIATPAPSFPGPLSWRRWEITARAVGRAYQLGLLSGYSFGYNGGDPIPGGTTGHLGLRGRRPYVLGKARWWWECQARQGWRLRGRHRPMEPWAFGVCAGCLRCPGCGAAYECNAGCPL